MARHGCIGNGSLLALYDENGYIKDLFFPFAGSENHVVSQTHRIAFKINNNKTYFLEDLKCKSYQSSKSLKYVVKTTTPENLAIKIENIVYNEKNVLIKKLTFYNLTENIINVKSFFNQEYKIKENKYRNTGYFYPNKNCVIHYQANRVFISGILGSFGGIDDYTIGLFDFEGKKGSYLACYQDNLPKNSIEHGPVDSVIAKSISINPKNKVELYYVLVAEKTIKKALNLYEAVEKITPKHIFKTTNDYWSVWKKESKINFYDLPNEVKKLYFKSIFVINTHYDKNTGGILASGDTEFYTHGKDNYSYVWARDSYFSYKSFLFSGFVHKKVDLLDFFNKTIEKEGFIKQKFEQSTSLGSSWHPYIDKNNMLTLPIQEDETAAVVSSVYNFYVSTKNIETLEKYFENLVKRPADFMIDYTIESLNLPKPSYDLWEEKNIISTYTTCFIIKALNDASFLCKVLKKDDLQKKYKEGSDKLKKGLVKYLYNEGIQSFVKGVEIGDNQEIINYDVTKDYSTVMAPWYFDIFDVNDKLVEKTVDFHKNLVIEKNTVIRFENDAYFKEPNLPTNAWFISSIWHLLYLIKKEKNADNLKILNTLIASLASYSTKSGILTEQFEVSSKKPIGYGPLTWSNAAFVELIIEYSKKYEELHTLS